MMAVFIMFMITLFLVNVAIFIEMATTKRDLSDRNELLRERIRIKGIHIQELKKILDDFIEVDGKLSKENVRLKEELDRLIDEE